MKGLRSLLILFFVVWAASGCYSTPQPEKTQTLPPVTQTVLTEKTAAPVLTIEDLRNFTYLLPYSQKTIQLVNGSYEGGAGSESLQVRLADLNATGDLNGDGLEDWAVLISETMGGSGVFESLVAVVSQNGEPVQAGSAQLGDRVQVNSLSIQQREVRVDQLVHAPNDSLCCPTQPQSSTYRLTDSGLFLVHVSTQTSGGALRDLTIESPAGGTLVSTSADIKGSFTIGPFENTLSCQLMAEDGTQISQQPITVQTAEMGAAGTFLVGVDFSLVPSGQKFFVVISDLSAADGSILTLDAVELLRQ